MSQNIRFDLSCIPEGFFRAGGSNPDWQFRLNGLRVQPNFQLVSATTFYSYVFTAPQAPYYVDTFIHDLLSNWILFREKDEIVSVPAGRKCDTNSSVRQV